LKSVYADSAARLWFFAPYPIGGKWAKPRRINRASRPVAEKINEHGPADKS
jgi:hypothetical protein